MSQPQPPPPAVPAINHAGSTRALLTSDCGSALALSVRHLPWLVHVSKLTQRLSSQKGKAGGNLGRACSKADGAGGFCCPPLPRLIFCFSSCLVLLLLSLSLTFAITFDSLV